MITLLPFQIKSAEQIAKRYMEFQNSENRPYETRTRPTPFYQALSALTGAGKTPILADAVVQMRLAMPVEPLVLWISKAKAVIDQTYKNFRPGGKYAHLVDMFAVTYLKDLTPDMIADETVPIISIATTGTFNQRDQAESSLRIYQVDQDRGSKSLWEFIKDRKTADGRRRDLIIVYDEGHNLSNQQIELLFDLEPEAILVASATLRTPGKLGAMIERLKAAGWQQNELVTSVSSKDVVEAQLVKKQIVLGGYETSMELALEPMLSKMKTLESTVKELGLSIRPKAIYVCKTNVNQEEGTLDDPAVPFDHRKAPPILIWRYLVQKGVDPSTIAVYCDLRFVRDFPPPKEFVLFSQGEKDFEEFQQGDYRHIIFNLSLQEGWDDPDCYLAYIDKSMESSVQIEQVIGRVLRQPCATHYPVSDLNTAHFYIRMDDRTVFPEILERVRTKIAAEFPEVDLDSFTDSGSCGSRILEPVKEVRYVPQTHIDASGAINPLEHIINSIHDYRADSVNTIGQGLRTEVIQKVASDETSEIISTFLPHTNKITARWVIDREIQKLYPRARGVCVLNDPKFDAKIEFTSRAYQLLREAGEEIVDTYLENSILISDNENLYEVGPVVINPEKAEVFTNALHSRYSGLNSLELSFARAIDGLGLPWARNPSNGGYSIPLLVKGTNRNFFPDFLVWKDNIVYALDPKADDLIVHDSGRKLFDIRDPEGHLNIAVRLFTRGEWIDNPITKINDRGYTVWALRAGRVWTRHYTTIEEAVGASLT